MFKKCRIVNTYEHKQISNVEEIRMKKGRILLFLLSGFILLYGLCGFTKREAPPSNEEVIRLHVIANSDSPEDQALKAKVRDQILAHFAEAFSQVRTIKESRALIKNHLKDIEKVAAAEIARNHYNYSVEATLGSFHFPTRLYGNKVYPAGEYEALRVSIGKAEGANWWCVMFPPLCFVDVSHGTAAAAGHEKPASEGEEVSGSDKEAPRSEGEPIDSDGMGQIQYKSKILEWWQQSQPQLTRIFPLLKAWE
jgi:stage II sporulation protein R